jgi:antitoxin FitA
LATLTIRNLNEETKAKLRQLAAIHGHSMEEEARRILNHAVSQEEKKGLGTEIAQMFAEIGGVDLPIPPRSPARALDIFAEEET